MNAKCTCPMCQFQDGPCQSRAKDLGRFVKPQALEPRFTIADFFMVAIAFTIITLVIFSAAERQQLRLDKINQEQVR
jgi:hypothetical protein